MRIKFNGIVEKRRKGCNCSRRVTESGFTTMKSYILPSGQTKTFRLGRVEEVSDTDGAFLLQYQYTDKTGQVVHVFEEVE